ncbi:decaprenyl-phosphate phosphoribosyltransferase [Actinorhabdospora filicis]|uniref:Decaprenyl-phosphate phosphoribosyltransferase n=1 Tax=Actinorhabdospora filicis TaxID=1785913 RepID=A0A9W6W3R3_9ACTN|nr:decaprenyl-phosphate phosphoribosyltransferase [Actinorhabdospora filicis]GLZ78442.1 decaprenyl-phosphate phosphoribosyltransferase [Actinorhabdospora filicis]
MTGPSQGTETLSHPAETRTAGRGFDIGAVVIALRPRQWLKNVLVFGAPLASGTITSPEVARGSMAAFGIFCAAASSVYLCNDVRDRAVDAHHPRKCRRPIAAGLVNPVFALVLALVLAVTALGGAWLVTPELFAVMVIYLVVQAAYCFGLREMAVVDLLVVTSGFLLRALAGGAACDIPVTGWFVSVIGFASLFVVAGKRFSEVVAADRQESGKRALAGVYTASYLRLVWGSALALTLAAYCLWVFEGTGADEPTPWRAVSIVPMVAAMLRYAQLVDGGTAEEPERVLLSDRMLIGCGVVWLVSITAATVLS